MGWQIKKNFKFGGVNINISKSGVNPNKRIENNNIRQVIEYNRKLKEKPQVAVVDLIHVPNREEENEIEVNPSLAPIPTQFQTDSATQDRSKITEPKGGVIKETSDTNASFFILFLLIVFGATWYFTHSAAIASGVTVVVAAFPNVFIDRL